MQVKDIMTKDIVYVDKEDSVLEVAKLMRHHNIGCIPVVENGQKVLGVITDRDIVLSMPRHKDLYNHPVTNIMSHEVYSVQPEAEIEQALELMRKQRIRRVPVIENDILVGMLSIGDVAVYDDCKMEISKALTEISKPARVKNI